jgi:hypothetical protein
MNREVDLQQAENRKCICAVVAPEHESGDQHLTQNLREFIPIFFKHIGSLIALRDKASRRRRGSRGIANGLQPHSPPRCCVGDLARRYTPNSPTGLLEGPLREMGLAILHMRTMGSVRFVADD